VHGGIRSMAGVLLRGPRLRRWPGLCRGILRIAVQQRLRLPGYLSLPGRAMPAGLRTVPGLLVHAAGLRRWSDLHQRELQRRHGWRRWRRRRGWARPVLGRSMPSVAPARCGPRRGTRRAWRDP
jgi:hypothetical protein